MMVVMMMMMVYRSLALSPMGCAHTHTRTHRLIFGPDWAGLLASNLLIIVPCGLFCGFVVVDWFRYIGIIAATFMLLVGLLLTSLSLFYLMKTGTTDPGFIPKNIETVKHLFKPDETDTMTSNRVQPPYKETRINDVIVRLKWCRTCKIYRPPRASHCKRCNSCIDRFDHHCPWTGTCIGRRNHRHFFAFVSITTILCIYATVCSVVEIGVFVWRATLPAHDSRSYKYHDMSVQQAFVQSLLSSPVSYLTILYSFVMGLSVGGLMFFHLYLLSRNITTYESVCRLSSSVDCICTT